MGRLTTSNVNTGEFSQEPFENTAGADSFTFRVSDTRTLSNAATVSVSISPVNDAPVALPGSLSVAAQGSATGTLTSSVVDASFWLSGCGTSGRFGGTAKSWWKIREL